MVNKDTTYSELVGILTTIFTEILPKYGCTVREKQIELAQKMLEAIDKRAILLSEAGTGIGKTHAYLIAAVLAKYGHLNDLKLSGIYPELDYESLSRLPIVISTSSIALQRAIVREYIPQI
ncbi:MAG: hypothetical protein FWD71_16865 [Oscillospiraceae bacterium]|nr:hypothetical protein [Oscillospiraceae bacterium]